MDERETSPQRQQKAVVHSSSSGTVDNVDIDCPPRGCNCTSGQLKLDGVCAEWTTVS